MVVVLVLLLGEVKARPIDSISFSLSCLSKSKVTTSNSPSNPTSLDRPARPTDSFARETQALLIGSNNGSTMGFLRYAPMHTQAIPMMATLHCAEFQALVNAQLLPYVPLACTGQWSEAKSGVLCRHALCWTTTMHENV